VWLCTPPGTGGCGNILHSYPYSGNDHNTSSKIYTINLSYLRPYPPMATDYFERVASAQAELGIRAVSWSFPHQAWSHEWFASCETIAHQWKGCLSLISCARQRGLAQSHPPPLYERCQNPPSSVGHSHVSARSKPALRTSQCHSCWRSLWTCNMHLFLSEA